jgi:hypothetical protein
MVLPTFRFLSCGTDKLQLSNKYPTRIGMRCESASRSRPTAATYRDLVQIIGIINSQADSGLNLLSIAAYVALLIGCVDFLLGGASLLVGRVGVHNQTSTLPVIAPTLGGFWVGHLYGLVFGDAGTASPGACQPV